MVVLLWKPKWSRSASRLLPTAMFTTFNVSLVPFLRHSDAPFEIQQVPLTMCTYMPKFVKSLSISENKQSHIYKIMCMWDFIDGIDHKWLNAFKNHFCKTPSSWSSFCLTECPWRLFIWEIRYRKIIFKVRDSSQDCITIDSYWCEWLHTFTITSIWCCQRKEG